MARPLAFGSSVANEERPICGAGGNSKRRQIISNSASLMEMVYPSMLPPVGVRSPARFRDCPFIPISNLPSPRTALSTFNSRPRRLAASKRSGDGSAAKQTQPIYENGVFREPKS